MKITTMQPPPPPREIVMTFSIDDGWAIVAALREYVDRHQGAVHRDEWRQWAKDLDDELRR